MATSSNYGSSSLSSEVSSGSDSSSRLPRLKIPKSSELARDRKTQCNPAPGKFPRRPRGHGTYDPKSVPPAKRVKEYPGEYLSDSNDKLFCNACREEIGLKSSVVRNHIQSNKHKNGKERLASKEVAERDIARAIQAASEQLHPRGETLPEEQQVYRAKVVRVFLRSATPLNKLVHFRGLLEENALRLSDRRQMSDIVPFVATQEQDLIKQEITGKHLSIAFDGTTRMGEAMAIVVRYVDSTWVVQQRLIRLKLLQKSMTGEEIAQVLIDTLSREYSVPPDKVLSCTRDRASSNNVAVRFLRIVFTQLIDIGCFSHTLDLVGDKMSVPHLSDFMISWLSLFSHSPAARILWKEHTGIPVHTYCPTRWWSKWECMNQVLDLFGDVEAFLTQHDIAPATRSKLLTFFSDQVKKAYLKVELAVAIDFGVNFVKATYNMESDGLVVFHCYEAVNTLTAAVDLSHYPNLSAIAGELSNGNTELQQQLEMYGKQCVQPSIKYYRERLEDSMKIPLKAFRAARIFLPSKVQEMKVDISSVDELAVYPFISSTTLEQLKAELPRYIASCEDVDPSYDVCKFWRNHSDSLPYWSGAAAKVITLQPSSATAERVFSILNQSFNCNQKCTLQDLVEASIMLQFNNRSL